MLCAYSFLPTLILFWVWQDEVCSADKDTDVESEMFQESVEFQECFEITSEKKVRLSKQYISRLVSTVAILQSASSCF